MTHLCRFGAVLGAMVLLFAAPALAEDGHPLDSALEMMNLKTRAGPMPDFVTQQRNSAAADTYIPVGAKPPTRSLKPKSPADVKALTAELDAARQAQLAGKRPRPMSADLPARPAGRKPVKGPGGAQAIIR